MKRIIQCEMYFFIMGLLHTLLNCGGFSTQLYTNPELFSRIKGQSGDYTYEERSQIEDLLRNPKNEIPHFFHFIWISPHLQGVAIVPVTVQNNVKTFEIHNPGWQKIIWSNNLIKYVFPELSIHLFDLDNTSQMSDIIRYHILERFGGVYLDTDIISIRELTSIVKKANELGDGVFTVCEKPHTTVITNAECDITCTAVIGAKANHPILASARSKVIKTLDECWESKTTGPMFWTKVHKSILNDILILPARSFYPCHWLDTSQCILQKFINESDVFAMHMWSHSWAPFNGQCSTVTLTSYSWAYNSIIICLILLIFAIWYFKRHFKLRNYDSINMLMTFFSKLRSPLRMT